MKKNLLENLADYNKLIIQYRTTNGLICLKPEEIENFTERGVVIDGTEYEAFGAYITGEHIDKDGKRLMINGIDYWVADSIKKGRSVFPTALINIKPFPDGSTIRVSLNDGDMFFNSVTLLNANLKQIYAKYAQLTTQDPEHYTLDVFDDSISRSSNKTRR